MFYTIARAIGKFMFFFLGLKSEGLHNLPKKGPIIVAANHVSNWDPIVVALVLNRQIHFMAKDELFKFKPLGRILTNLNAFPVRRGSADRKAIRYALEVLEKGKVLGIFPEGLRNKAGEEMKAQAGTAMLAVKSNAPVIPIACIGTGKKLPSGWISPLVVKVGKPITFEEYKGQKVNSVILDEISSRIMNEISLLLSDKSRS